ncbi:MAG: hypothetical protein AAGB34_08975, partial [Planctomycetota bacterium]
QEWIENWVGVRPELKCERDQWGNIHIQAANAPNDINARPIYIVAHMDHPCFVVEEVLADEILKCTFRGGVLDPYFKDAPVTIFTGSGERKRGIVRSYERGKRWLGIAEIEVQGGSAAGIGPGDLARWEMKEAEIDNTSPGRGMLRTAACDNLTSVIAALATIDRLIGTEALTRTRLLLTRAEEVGFIGAICAARSPLIPQDARIIVLENSRSFDDSPIGGGVILRVGDRVSVFDPELTAAIGKTAIELANESKDSAEPFLWQRKLMPGGACEASVFGAYGWPSTCLCLPLGNYHNMAALDEVQAGNETAIANARCAREYVALDDFFSMVRLLERSCQRIEQVAKLRDRLDQYFDSRKRILEGKDVLVANH